MLNENSLVLCGATIGSNSFEDLVRAANLGGFDAISLMATFYEDALSRGLTINDMENIQLDNTYLFAKYTLPKLLSLIDLEKVSEDKKYWINIYYRCYDSIFTNSIFCKIRRMWMS